MMRTSSNQDPTNDELHTVRVYRNPESLWDDICGRHSRVLTADGLAIRLP